MNRLVLTKYPLREMDGRTKSLNSYIRLTSGAKNAHIYNKSRSPILPKYKMKGQVVKLHQIRPIGECCSIREIHHRHRSGH